jgi:DNA-binding response OmpR family regulator
MAKKRILWVDDEIDSLKPHIIFLEQKGFEVDRAISGEDALVKIRDERYDLVLLDEMMPGKDGLTTLEEMKEIKPHLPVVMVTKSEEESLMEEAIGQKIADYLTKPVNPSQVLLVTKRILDTRKIISESQMKRYISDINRFSQKLYGALEPQDWLEAARILAGWDLELDENADEGLLQTHMGTRKEWNIEFTKYLEKNYSKWLLSDDRPTLSPDLMEKYLIPSLKDGRKVLLLVVDCMRLDQWMAIEPMVADYYNIARETYFSILPSATPFARNALFAGMFPDDIARIHPDIYRGGDEGSLNRKEDKLLADLINRHRIRLKGAVRYEKIYDNSEGEALAKRIADFYQSEATAFVFNFLDILAHGRSNNIILKEIAGSEAAFRSLMKSWFVHSPLFTILKSVASRDFTVIVTSDHGSTLCSRGTIAHGRRDTSTNLRYKYGDNLNCDAKNAWLIKNPGDFRLPEFGLATTYLIAKEDFFFVYPNNYHEYIRQFSNSFQHGGISLEEMVVPIAVMNPK